MANHSVKAARAAPVRQIGTIGTAARVVFGLLLVVDGLVNSKFVISHGQPQIGFDIRSVAVGLAVFPALLLLGQWLRTRINPGRLNATGPVATAINILVFLALILTPRYAPPIFFLSGAALLFYGASMLLAAMLGYGGCEVLAIANWILGRDDQVGCLILSPVDSMERRRRR